MAVKKKDSPALCILFGSSIGLIAAILLWGWRFDFFKESALQPISGRVQAVFTTKAPKSGPQLNIYLRDSARLWHLVQHDMHNDAPSISMIRVGDLVTARVGSDLLNRDIYWLWELQRGDEVLLRYDQTLRSLQKRSKEMRSVSYGGIFLAGLFFLIGALLRRHFGAWSSGS